MFTKIVRTLFGIFFVIYASTNPVLANEITNPCAGATALLNIIDRPTNLTSACVVPFKKIELETGYQHQQLLTPGGGLDNFPNAELRIGLPANNELFIFMPDYNYQNLTPHSGFSDNIVGIKHEIGYNKKWLVSVEGALDIPDGSAQFGHHDLGAYANGIISYTINEHYNLSMMLGASTVTQSRLAGGKRYNSVNPDLVLTYLPVKTINCYGEIYGQSKTGAYEGSGFNSDVGVLFLIKKHFIIDFSVGQRIYGSLGGFERYASAGLTGLFP